MALNSDTTRPDATGSDQRRRPPAASAFGSSAQIRVPGPFYPKLKSAARPSAQRRRDAEATSVRPVYLSGRVGANNKSKLNPALRYGVLRLPCLPCLPRRAPPQVCPLRPPARLLAGSVYLSNATRPLSEPRPNLSRENALAVLPGLLPWHCRGGRGPAGRRPASNRATQ